MLQPLYFFLLPLFFMHSLGIHEKSDSPPRNCPSYEPCADGVPIRYPFWRTHFTAANTFDQYCGYRNFGLSCSNTGETMLRLPSDTFHVKDINYTNHSISLADDVYGTNQTCSRPRHNLTLENLPLRYSNLNWNLIFYFNCTSNPFLGPSESNRSFALDCLRFQTKQSYVLLLTGNERDQSVKWFGNCEESVRVMVLKSQFNGSLDGVISQGFVLDWGTARECGHCEASVGLCGFRNSSADQEFLCFCKDGAVRSNHCSGRQSFEQVPEASDRGGSFKVRSKLVIGVASGGTVIVIICIILCFKMIFSKEKAMDNQQLQAFLRNRGPLAPKKYSFSDVKKMTNFFKEKLGQGGYGIVYKGMLKDGHLVAVKVLNASKGNGEEFMNEVASVSRTSHVNIVTLLGFCLEGGKKVLIYDFMPNGSLEKFINNENVLPASQQLGWEKLYHIAVGVARGLEYLHRGCNTRIVHFDIKPHNILLDADFCPKISDFGLAKPCARKESIMSTMEARGTIGYIAPEVFSRSFGKVSHKSDVYSYGMMILEMVGGRRNHEAEAGPSSENYFPQWIYKRLELGTELELNGVTAIEEADIVRKITVVGLWCIQSNPSDRPTISKVIEMLEGPIEALNIPPKPFLSSPPRLLSYSSSASSA